MTQVGRVRWFSDKLGYGFIILDDGQQVFVHFSAIDCPGYKTLTQGQRVECDIENTPRGLIAKNVFARQLASVFP